MVYLGRDEEAIAKERLHWWDGSIKPHTFLNWRSGVALGAHRQRHMSLADDWVGDNQFSLV